MESVDTRAQATQYRLESELSGYKTNLIKESIRMGHHDLADFFYARGDLQVRTSFHTPPAMLRHIRAVCRAVCATSQHFHTHPN